MSSTDTDDTGHYQGVLLESINDRLKAILEGQDNLLNVPKKLHDINNRLIRVENRLKHVETDVKFIKTVVSEQAGALDNHETRLKHLETTPA